MHGGVARAELSTEDVTAVQAGTPNLLRHVRNMQGFGLPVVVCLNHFTGDTDAELDAIRDSLAPLGVDAILCRHWAEGAAGVAELAHAVQALLAAGLARFAPLYPDAMPLAEKLRTIARSI